MTGGAFKNTSNLLGRRREIEELEERCQRCLDEVHRIEKELSLREGELTGPSGRTGSDPKGISECFPETEYGSDPCPSAGTEDPGNF